MSSYYLSSSKAILLFCVISFVLHVSLLGIFTPTKIAFVFADLNFGAVGDWGCSSNTHNIKNGISSKNPGRVLGLGDYS
jgi:hypothetical protein